MEEVVQNLPKYFSPSHKQKVCKLMEKVVFNKISPAQFRFIHHEITGDNTSSENIKQTEYDERINLIIKNSDESLIKDLRVNNARKLKYDKFWDIAKQQLDESTIGIILKAL